MAQIWKLPVIFLCQNNLYGEHTPQAFSTGAKEIVDRAIAYGMKGVQVNGNDAIAMHQAAKDAVDRARAGEGPTLLEAKTFRFNGHLVGDDSHYIPKEEMQAAREADPVPALRNRMLESGFTEAKLDAIVAAIQAVVDDAITFAQESPYPAVEENLRDAFNKEIAA